jgi:hypothetical protein
MFRGGRDFRVIAFSSPQITSSKDVIKYLPYDVISSPEEICLGDIGLSFSHLYYYREDPFNPAHENIESIQVERNGTKCYQYNMYIATIPFENKDAINIIAVPFTSMAIELFTFFNKKISGHNNRYLKVDIEKFINAVKTGNNANGDIKITRLELDIEGDSPTKTAVLGGSDVPNSITFDSIKASLLDMTIRYRKCKLVYDDKSYKKIVLEADRFGNYTIPLHMNAKNLPCLRSIFSYFYDINGIIEDAILPSMRTLQEEG